jgi:hypothetical protein
VPLAEESVQLLVENGAANDFKQIQTIAHNLNSSIATDAKGIIQIFNVGACCPAN